MEISIDETDIKILNLLQQNARLSHKEMGDRLHKAPTTIFTRIAKMEKAGLIRAYVALLAPARVRRGQTIFTHVQLNTHSEESMRFFCEAILAMPEVMECYQLTGAFDFMLRVVVEDVASFEQFLVGSLFKTGLIAKTESTIIIREIKKETAYALSLNQVQRS